MSGDSGGRGGGGRGKRSNGVRESARGVIDKSAMWVGREWMDGGAGFESQIERERHTPTHTHKARECRWGVGCGVTGDDEGAKCRACGVPRSTAQRWNTREGKGRERKQKKTCEDPGLALGCGVAA